MSFAYNYPTFGTSQFPIIAALPMFAGRETPDHYLVVCMTRGISSNDTAEYALASADSLDADDWQIVTYTADLAQALKLMYLRSEIAAVVTHGSLGLR